MGKMKIMLQILIVMRDVIVAVALSWLGLGEDTAKDQKDSSAQPSQTVTFTLGR